MIGPITVYRDDPAILNTRPGQRQIYASAFLQDLLAVCSDLKGKRVTVSIPGNRIVVDKFAGIEVSKKQGRGRKWKVQALSFKENNNDTFSRGIMELQGTYAYLTLNYDESIVLLNGQANALPAGDSQNKTPTQNPPRTPDQTAISEPPEPSWMHVKADRPEEGLVVDEITRGNAEELLTALARMKGGPVKLTLTDRDAKSSEHYLNTWQDLETESGNTFIHLTDCDGHKLSIQTNKHKKVEIKPISEDEAREPIQARNELEAKRKKTIEFGISLEHTQNQGGLDHLIRQINEAIKEQDLLGQTVKVSFEPHRDTSEAREEAINKLEDGAFSESTMSPGSLQFRTDVNNSWSGQLVDLKDYKSIKLQYQPRT